MRVTSQIFDGGVAGLSRFDQSLRPILAKPVNLSEAEAQSGLAVFLFLQRIVPTTRIYVDRPDFDAMLAGIANDLRWRVEAHRLCIEKGASEHSRMVTFEPRRNIDEPGEGSCV